MGQKIFYAPVNHPHLGDELNLLFKHAIDAYCVAPHVWNMGGNNDVCAYLMDTGDGLVLLDTGYRASVYLMVDHIWRLGFDPADIHKVLLSHWHWDHANGASYIQGLSDCEIWLSQQDEVLYQKWKDDTSELPMAPYDVANFYDFQKPIEVGSMSIHVRLTPGRTPGAVAFFFDDTDESTGKTYCCAMHGGLEIPIMRPENLQKWDITKVIVRQFIRDCDELEQLDIDIAFPSHLNMGNVLANMPANKSDYSTWVAPYTWKHIVESRKRLVQTYYTKSFFEGKDKQVDH